MFQRKLFIAIVLFALIESMAAGAVNLSLITGEGRYFKDDILKLSIDLLVDESFSGDVWLAMMEPNGTILFAPEWTTNPAPVLTNINFPAPLKLKNALIYSANIPSVTPPIETQGAYVFAIGITRTVTSDFLDIALVNTEYIGEREWEVVDLELSKACANPSCIIDDYVSDGGYWIGFCLAELQVHYKDSVLREYDSDDGIVQNNIYYAGYHKDYLYDYQGDLWIASWSGLFKYQPQSDNFSCYTSIEYENDNWVKGAFCSIVNNHPGSFWVASGDGLWLFDSETEKWTYYSKEDFGLESSYVTELVKDLDGNLWFSVSTVNVDDPYAVKGGVVKYDGIKFTTYSSQNTFVSGRCAFSCIELDSEGCIWVGSSYGALNRYVNGEWLKFSTEDGLITLKTNCIYADRFGKVWIGLEGAKLAQFKDGSFVTVLPELTDLGLKSIVKIYQDAKNNYWFIGISSNSPYNNQQKLFKWGK